MNISRSIIGKSSGIIVDTPSSFATGVAGAPNDKKYALVKTCVDAFHSMSTLLLDYETVDIKNANDVSLYFGARLK